MGGSLIYQSSATVWQLNKDRHHSPESSLGPVIHHIQEVLEAVGCGISRMPVQDEVVASVITATTVRVLIKPPTAH